MNRKKTGKKEGRREGGRERGRKGGREEARKKKLLIFPLALHIKTIFQRLNI